MPREYFSILGLSRGEYTRREITRRFEALRAHLDRAACPDTDAVRNQRDDLYLAYATLRDPRRQADYRYALQHGTTPQRELQRLISAALEDDLLRHSRREAILAEGRRIGLSDFHTQLLIAEVQFGQPREPAASLHAVQITASQVPMPTTPHEPVYPLPDSSRSRRAALRLAAAGTLAAVLFVAAQRWLA